MSSKQVEQLRRAKPREFDAMVAEKVMGWPMFRDVEPRPAPIPHALVYKDKVLLASGIDKPGFEGVVGKYVHWHPSEDVAADYATFDLVRKTWNADGCTNMHEALWDIWEERRLASDDPRAEWMFTRFAYEPGDYSAAALVAIGRAAASDAKEKAKL